MNVTTMSDQSLIEELLSLSPHTPSANTLRSGELPPLTEMQCSEHLQRILGVAKELLIRRLRNDWLNRPLMDSSAAFHDWVSLRCADLDHEQFLVVYLDAHYRILDVETMFRGTLTQTSVYPREVVKAALERRAAAVAFIHNHPSGNPEPSLADKSLTMTLKAALALVDIRCVDHFIVAGNSLLSMAERGLM